MSERSVSELLEELYIAAEDDVAFLSALQARPELLAALRADAELRAVYGDGTGDGGSEVATALAPLARADAALASAATIHMPRELATRIAQRVEGGTLRRWLRETLFAPWRDGEGQWIAAAAALLLLLPLAAVLALQPSEFTPLELGHSSVRFDLQAALSQQQQALFAARAGGSPMQSTAQQPVFAAPLVAADPAYLPVAERALTEGAPQKLLLQPLVNAFRYAAPASRAPAVVLAEVGPAPWSANAWLVRVFVDAREALDEAALTVAFDETRIASYRLLGEPPRDELSAAVAAPRPMAFPAGAQTTLLFEVVPTVSLGDVAGKPPEALAVATLRFVRGGEAQTITSAAVDRRRVAFEALELDYRFAAIAAHFALELRGELGGSRTPREAIFARMAAVASRLAQRTEPARRDERLALAALIADQAKQASKK